LLDSLLPADSSQPPVIGETDQPDTIAIDEELSEAFSPMSLKKKLPCHRLIKQKIRHSG
jgi:hypothetical protein